MQQAITAVRHAETAAFNEAVAARYRTRCGQSVRTNVTRINGLPVERTSGQVVGDIDVLAAERASQTIWSVETKDLGLARTPSEMGHQLEKIFIGRRDTLAMSIAMSSAPRGWRHTSVRSSIFSG